MGGGLQSGGGNPRWRSAEALDGSYHGNFAGGDTGLAPVDADGTYSRFFLIPKADRADREPVLGGLQEGRVSPKPDGRQWDIPGSHSRDRQNVSNTSGEPCCSSSLACKA